MRITQKMLEGRVEDLNHLTKSPLTYATRDSEGKLHCNIGHFCLSGAYSGWALERITSEGGGVTSIFNCGHIPRRQLYDLIGAYAQGLRDVQSGRVELK